MTPSLRHAVSWAVDENNQPRKALFDLAQLHGWEHDGTLAGLVAITQRECIPRDETGRPLKTWDIPPDADNRFADSARLVTFAILDSLGQSGDAGVMPNLQRYHYLLIHGHWPPDAWMRVQLVCQLWLSGVRFDQIVILASQLRVPDDVSIGMLLTRGVLDADSIDPQALNTIPITEASCVEWLLRAAAPPGMLEEIEVSLIETPHQMIAGRAEAANTRQSLCAWRDACPAQDDPEWFAIVFPGNSLSITNGWQTPRQGIITPDELLSWNCGFDRYSIETIGAPGGYQHSLTVRLREFAAALWEVNNALQSIQRMEKRS